MRGLAPGPGPGPGSWAHVIENSCSPGAQTLTQVPESRTARPAGELVWEDYEKTMRSNPKSRVGPSPGP